MLNAALVTDLHLTDTPRDKYRWELFPWLGKTLRTSLFPIYYLFILGDLTQAKDYHSSKLVNKIADAVTTLVQDACLKRIYILRGNHDGLDPDCPYFRFLRHLPAVQYVETQWMEDIGRTKILMLPHTKNPRLEWVYEDFYDADVILMHATVEGSVAENGMTLNGVHHGYFRGIRADIYSGDVHVPQTVGKIKYIGAPYPIHFGDKFVGGAVLLKNGKFHSELPFNTLHRWMLDIQTPEDLQKVEVQEGDQCKIRLALTPAEYLNWKEYKKQVIEWCAKEKVELFGIELAQEKEPRGKIKENLKLAVTLPPEQIIRDHCKQHRLGPDLQTTGLSLIRGLS